MNDSTNIGSAVLSLCICNEVEASTRASILVGVRDPSSNSTHPNVVSVPTERIPNCLFAALREGAIPVEHSGTATFYESSPIKSTLNNGHHPLVYAVKALFSRKLGLAEHIETQAIEFEAALRATLHGVSVYHDSSPARSEEISMATVWLTLTRGADLLPSRTASYSRLRWVRVPEFVRSVQEKNPVFLDFDPFECCIHGLCIASSYDLLARALGCTRYFELSRAEQ